jgi:hypothetical protein
LKQLLEKDPKSRSLIVLNEIFDEHEKKADNWGVTAQTNINERKNFDTYKSQIAVEYFYRYQELFKITDPTICMYTLGSLIVAQPCFVLATNVMNGQTGATEADRLKFKNSLRAFSTILREQGVRGFYRGTSASCAILICGMIWSECLMRQCAKIINKTVQDTFKDCENDTFGNNIGKVREFFEL